jgi:hypothetical protein
LYSSRYWEAIHGKGSSEKDKDVGMRASTNTGSQLLIYWVLFFFICFGLGYPSVGRFDARSVSPDAVEYYKLVAGRPLDAVDLVRYRLLVPWIAKPFAWISRGHIGSWQAVPFGLLISNCLFTATGGLLLLLVGTQCLGRKAAFAGTLLYLLNFTIPNKQLGLGLVDSGEACFMLALFFLLFRRKFFLLPIIGFLGALAKESFVPMCAAATAGWAICDYRNRKWKGQQTFWSIMMVLIGLSTVVLVQASVGGHLIWPWEFARGLRQTHVSLLGGLLGCFRDRYFLYTFIWLLPLGVIKLCQLPTAWLWASIVGAAAALAMGAWNNASGNTVPAIFNSIGPILSLSAAQLLIGDDASEKAATLQVLDA